MKCYRWNIQVSSPINGLIVDTSPEVYVTGLDYAGPIAKRHGGAKSRILSKEYVALFVCFSTRTIHLEFVSYLTSVAFIVTIRSDNETDFNNRILSEFLNNNSLRRGILEYSNQEGIDWRFIPPHAHHFGGLWEAGVKSTKYHIRGFIGDSLLNFEELYRMLSQIEAVINSRPIMAVSDDTDNLEALASG